MKELRDFIDQPVDLERLVKELPFEEEDFVRASLRQPKLFLEAGRLRVQKTEKLSTRKRRLDILEAELGTNLRAQKEGGKKGLTAKAIDEQIVLHPRYQKLRQLVDEAHAEDRAAEILFDAYRTRRDMLKLIADVRNSEVAHELRGVRDRMMLQDTEEVRERAEKRIRSEKR